MPVGAIIGGSVIAGGASMYASNKAADAQEKGYDAATAEQRRQFDIAYQAGAPYRAAGENALKQLGNPSKYFTASPDYEFVRSEGTRGLENTAAARGGAFSGNALRGIDSFNTNLASGEFGNWWNRQAGLAGQGAGAAATAGNQAIASGNAVAGNMIGSSNARASGYYNAAGGVNNAVQGGLSNWLTYDMLSKRPVGSV